MDDDTVEEVSTEAVVISVETPETPPVEIIEPPAETGAVEAVVVDAAISHEGRIAALESVVGMLAVSVEELTGRVESSGESALQATATADLALDIAIESAAEPEAPAELEPSAEPEESTDDDISPDSSRKHPMFRTYKEWKRK